MISSERVSCPQTAILAEFSKNLSVEKGVSLRTEIDSLVPICSKDDDRTLIDFRLRLTSFRPRSTFHHPLKHTVSYFVAVVDKEGHVLSRSDHDLEISFAEKQTTNVTFVKLRERVPPHHDLSLFVGFNLDEKQYELAKKERDKEIHIQN